MGGWWEDKLHDAFAAVTRGVASAKLGPGVLGTIVPIMTIGFLALAILGYALATYPVAAVLIVGLGFAVLVYAVERSFRYAEKNPLPALLSGTEIFQLIKDQTAAKDGSIVIEAAPVVGVPSQIVGQGGDHA
jgi:hypothetical protein